jgi:hypothetical protein
MRSQNEEKTKTEKLSYKRKGKPSDYLSYLNIRLCFLFLDDFLTQIKHAKSIKNCSLLADSFEPLFLG